MSKRIVYQCDRCSKQKEQVDQPEHWPSVVASYPPPVSSWHSQTPPDEKLFCDVCWTEIRRALPVAKKEAPSE